MVNAALPGGPGKHSKGDRKERPHETWRPSVLSLGAA